MQYPSNGPLVGLSQDYREISKFLLRFVLFAMLSTTIAPLHLSAQATSLDELKNYGYVYFENGYPTRLASIRTPQSDANLAARENPDLVFQTGYYSLMLDTDDVAIKGYDALSGSDYMTALNEDVTVFTPATLNLFVYVGGVRYKCVESEIQATDGENMVRLIESGQFLQRVDHVNLTFQDPISGNYLNQAGALEIAVWPDRFVLTLDCSGITGVTRTTIQMFEPDGTMHLVDKGNEDVINLTMSPVDTPLLDASLASSAIVEATRLSDAFPLNTGFNESTNALVIDIPTERISYPADKDRLDEYVIEVTNPTSAPINLPLVFEEVTPRAITGTVMTLCGHETTGASGYPLGYPVQISKNWHNDYEDKFSAHPNSGGQWLRGSTMLTLDAGESKRFRLRVIHGYWNSIPAVSHAQLCLIGYGKTVKAGTWKWDESALGAWGESLTYDPSMHLSGTYLNDIRPSLTSPMHGAASHAWTENVGGAGFLIYRDQNDVFRHLKRVKTAYRWTGPNMTQIHYSAVTDDDRIRVNNKVSLVRSYDYHRTFMEYRYEFLEAVTSPQRLAFFQMSADYYKKAEFSDFYYRNGTGPIYTDIIDDPATSAKGYYDSFQIEDGWIAFDDQSGSGFTSKAFRGLIISDSEINATPFAVSMHKYQSAWGDDQLILDLSAVDRERSYDSGLIVEGKLQVAFPAKTTSDYWGDDTEFLGRLAAYSTPYDAIKDEAEQNDYTVTVHRGTLVDTYPLEVISNPTGAAIDVTIDEGGIGNVPVIVRDVDDGHFIRVQRWMNGGWQWLEDVNLTQNQNYYQGIRNGDRKMDFVFNIKRPDTNLANSWRFRVLKVAY
ncbi:MAG: hypothetical protein AAGH40_07700 [Verrucomicrobiota bacterium]